MLRTGDRSRTAQCKYRFYKITGLRAHGWEVRGKARQRLLQHFSDFAPGEMKPNVLVRQHKRKVLFLPNSSVEKSSHV